MTVKGIGFIMTLGILLGSLAAQAQQTGKVYRIGFLGNSTAALEANLVGPFREGLRDLGYVEGRSVLIEYRWAEGKFDRFPALIGELLAVKVAVIVTAGTPATLAVKKATTSVPLVMIAVGDPVGTGIVPSLSHFWREHHRGDRDLDGNGREATRTAQGSRPQRLVRMRVLSLGIKTEEEIESALAVMVRERPDALLVLADRLLLHHRALIMDFATRHRLPGVYAYRELVEAGGLMSFGPSYADMHKRAAYFVDRILRKV